MKIPLAQFGPRSGERFAGCLAYRTRKVVLSHEQTVVLTYNEHLLEGQFQGINASLQKARRKLDEFQTALRRRQEGRVKGGQSPTVQTVSRRVDTILSGQFLKLDLGRYQRA